MRKENKITPPLLSVCLITYNHVKYIKQAIEGVLMQDVDFSWELIIADDFSTDGTREILLSYKEKYPEFITLIFQEKNVGPAQNWLDLIQAPKSKYIAYFEGDDYWTVPQKLKKQIFELENNSKIALCFHNAKVTHENTNVKDYLFCNGHIKEITTIEDVVNGWYIPSLSMVYRRDLLILPEWIKFTYNGDYAMHLLLAEKGDIKYIDEVMGIYRKQAGGLNAKSNSKIVWRHKISLMNYFNVHSNFKYNPLIRSKVESLFNEYENIIKEDKTKLQKILSIGFWKKKITQRLTGTSRK